MEFEIKRKRLVEGLRQHNISERVLAAIESVPRHLFVPGNEQTNAYADYPLPIGCGQTISAPHMVAIMFYLIVIKEGMKILEIGTGSGYHAAVMLEIAGSGYLYTVERIEALALTARDKLKKAGITNVTVIVDDGTLGLSNFSPYDRISVAAASPEILD